MSEDPAGRTCETVGEAMLTTVLDPPCALIPAGWFMMGCETGRDEEKPVHRVWVDAFEMAVM